MPVCGQYNKLAQNARIKAEKIGGFFNELSALIFQDMKKNAEEQIRKIVEKGRAVEKDLTADSEFPYAYIADEIKAATDELSAMPLDRMNVQILEDTLFRLDIVAFAADADTLRTPSHKALFDGISAMKEQVRAALEFFQSLSGDLAQVLSEPEKCARSTYKKSNDLGFEGNILLFYLKGEIQKLGNARLSESQQAVFSEICNQLNNTIRLAYHASDETDMSRIGENLRTLYKDLKIQADNLGEYGEAVRYIAENLKQLAMSV